MANTSTDNSKPRPITRPENHDVVMALLDRMPRGEVLDAACGEGALSVRLRDAGFGVRCCDIDPALMKAEGFESKQVDLNRGRIDYADSMFDYVICVNGLHRLYNIYNAVAEFHRLLKPGGTLVISIPNYTSIVRRMRFLLTGTIARNIAGQSFKQITEDPAAHFRNPLSIQQVLSTLEAHGFRLEYVTKGRTRRRAILLCPVALLVKLVAPVLYRRYRDLFRLDVVNSAAVLLGGNHVFTVATKV